MASSTTQLDVEQFLREFLPYPNDVPNSSNPTRNPFDTLENANTMPENDVSKLIVSCRFFLWLAWMSLTCVLDCGRQ